MDAKTQKVREVVEALRTQRYQEADAIVTELLRAHGDDVGVLHLAGVVARQRGELDRAVALLSAAVRLQPNYGRAHADLGLTYNALNRNSEAIVALEAAVSLGSDKLDDYINLAALLQSQDLDRSTEVLAMAVSKWPGNADLWLNLVRMYGRLERSEEVVATIEAAIAALPPEAAATFGDKVVAERAASLFELARWDEAEPWLRRALTTGASDRRWLYHGLSRIALSRPRPYQDEIRALFERLLTDRCGDGFAAGLTAVADIVAAQGRHDDAMALLGKCQTVWSRHFTLKTLLRLQDDARAVGCPLPPPPPAGKHDGPAVSATFLAYYGRFAHVLSEYLALRLYCETHGLALEIPDWVGRAVFELNEPEPQGPRPLRRRVSRQLAASLSSGAPPLTGVDIFSPGFFCDTRHRARFAEWLRPRAVWQPRLQLPLERLRARCRTLVAMHLRRTDLSDENAEDLAQHLAWLRDNWSVLDAPLLYVATDDETGLRAALAEFAPVMLHELVPPWPDLEFLQDFHILRHADVLLLSHRSSFGWLAGLLNLDARSVWQAAPTGLTKINFG